MEDQSALERNKRINVIERKKKQAERKKEQNSLKERKSKSKKLEEIKETVVEECRKWSNRSEHR